MSQIDVVDGKVRYEGKTLAEWVSEIVEGIVDACDPVRVILYGSVASGDDGPDSDLDLMVVLPSLDYSTRHQWMAKLRSVVTPLVPVQIFVTDVRECGRRRDVIGSMHYWPLREGKVVFERAA